MVASPIAASSSVGRCGYRRRLRVGLHPTDDVIAADDVSSSYIPQRRPACIQAHPELREFVVQLEQCDGAAGHFQAGHIRPTSCASLSGRAAWQSATPCDNDVEFGQRACRPGRSHRATLRRLLEGQVGEDGLHQHGRDFVGGRTSCARGRARRGCRCDFHLVFGQVEGGMADVRHGAGGERHAHAAAPAIDALADIRHFGQ